MMAALQTDQGWFRSTWIRVGDIMWSSFSFPKTSSHAFTLSWGMLKTCPGGTRGHKVSGDPVSEATAAGVANGADDVIADLSVGTFRNWLSWEFSSRENHLSANVFPWGGGLGHERRGVYTVFTGLS